MCLRLHPRLCLGLAMSLLAASLCLAGAPPADPIRIEARPADGEASLILENRFIQAILLPQRAAVPLTLTYKPTGQELFVRAADLKQGVARQHGNLLCLPWVSDSLKKGPAKGYLRTAEWRVSLEQDGERAACRAEADIAYRDPVTDHPASLRFVQVARGTADAPTLSLDYAVSNRGDTEARFILAAHLRLAPGGSYKAGDYLVLPGTRAWLGDFKRAAFSEQGLKPNRWIDWPVEALMRFAPRTGASAKGEFAYVYVPSGWALAGHDPSKTFLLVHATPMTINGRTQEGPYFCLLQRDGDYLLEITTSRALGTACWSDPWAAVTLAPGDTLAYTLSLTPGQGLDYVGARRVTDANPARLRLAPPEDGHAPSELPLAGP